MSLILIGGALGGVLGYGYSYWSEERRNQKAYDEELLVQQALAKIPPPPKGTYPPAIEMLAEMDTPESIAYNLTMTGGIGGPRLHTFTGVVGAVLGAVVGTVAHVARR